MCGARFGQWRRLCGIAKIYWAWLTILCQKSDVDRHDLKAAAPRAIQYCTTQYNQSLTLTGVLLLLITSPYIPLLPSD